MTAALRLVQGGATATDPFDGARACFDEIITRLRSDEAMSMEHGDLEDLLFAEGNELLRQLLQSHLDQRAAGRVTAGEVTGADDVTRNEVRERERDLETRFGTVKVNRAGYGKLGVNSLFPLDGDLNLPASRYSHGVQRVVAEEAAKGSFDEVVATIGQYTGAHVPKRQAEQVVVATAQDFDEFYAQRGEQARAARGRSASLLVLTTDGVGVPVYPEDLREPKKRKERTGSKLVERNASGEKPGKKRMATVAAVYTIKPYRRTAQDILCDGILQEKGARPKPEHKRVWADIIDDAEKVIEDAFLEALRRDPKRKKRCVVLVDGNPAQLAAVHRLAEQYGVEVTVVLDCVHVAEYVWKAASCFHPDSHEERKQWVGERLMGILSGNASHVAAGMRRSATLRELAAKDRAAADECADYLLNYSSYLRYDEYLADGLPIATGVVEGAGRYLVQDRMDISGARWHLPTAEAVLRLRALRASGDFAAYWAFHKRKEHERTHGSKYKDKAVPKLQLPSRRPHLRVVK